MPTLSSKSQPLSPRDVIGCNVKHMHFFVLTTIMNIIKCKLCRYHINSPAKTLVILCTFIKKSTWILSKSTIVIVTSLYTIRKSLFATLGEKERTKEEL